MLNILEECTCYLINLLKLSDETRALIDKEYSIDADCPSISISGNEVSRLNIPEEAIDYDCVGFDSNRLEDIMEEYLGIHPAYLLFGSGMRYNGSSGYKVVNSLVETCERNYDISLYLKEDLGNDTIICLESSHDSPTGHEMIMIGLNDEEVEAFEEYDFDEVEEFVNKKIKR